MDEQTVNNLETRHAKRRPSSLAAVLAALDKAEAEQATTTVSVDGVSEVRLEPDGTLIVRGNPPPDTIATVERLRRLRDRDSSERSP